MLSPPYAVTEMTVFFFTRSALSLGLAKNFTTFSFLFISYFGGLVLIDDVLCKQSDQGRATSWLGTGLVCHFFFGCLLNLYVTLNSR